MASQNKNTSLNLPGSSSSEVLECADHTKNVLKNMRSAYEGKELSDIVLIAETDNSKIHAHKIVLFTCSEFFRGMFLSGMKETKADEVNLKEIDGATLTSVVDFMYTASIELTNETVERVLIAANHFQMNNLVALCSDFMGKRLDDCNCLGVAFFAEQHNATALCKKATTFALTHFESVCKEKEFLDLNKEQLIGIISSDDLRVSSEESVFLSLVAWVEYDKNNRQPLILNIFSQVRFTLLKPRFIIKNRHSVCKTIEGYELICNWLEWHLSPESRSGYPIESVKPRKTNKKLYVTSGVYTNDLKVQKFDRDLNTWSFVDLPCPLKNRVDYRLIGMNEKLIVAGGKIAGDETNTVECYDFQTKKWTRLPPMLFSHSWPGMAELNGELYVVGSWNNGNVSRWVEKYNFASGKWKEVASLLTPLKLIQLTVLDGLLYAIGGDDSTLQCYNPNTNQWTQTNFKSETWIDFAFAGVGGHLYTMGGTYNGEPSRKVERYNPSTDILTELIPLRIGHSSLLCAALNNRLIACRKSSNNSVNIVEEYNPVTNEWTTLAPLVPLEINMFSSSIFTM